MSKRSIASIIVLALLFSLVGCGSKTPPPGVITINGKTGYVIRIEEEDLSTYFTIKEVIRETALVATDGKNYVITTAKVEEGGYILFSNSWILNVVYLPDATEEETKSALLYAKQDSKGYMTVEQAAEYIPWISSSK